MRPREMSLVVAALTIVVTVVACPALGQSVPYEPILDGGQMPFRAYTVGNVDSVDLATGNLNVHIPLVSFPQRGGRLSLDYFISYNTLHYYEKCNNPIDPTSCTWLLTYGSQTEGSTGLIVTNNLQPWVITTTQNISGNNYTSESLFESDGSSHPLAWTSLEQSRTVDGSGFSVGTNGITDRNGISYSCTSQGEYELCTSIDPNGNQITFPTTGGVVDTMGRQIPSPTIPIQTSPTPWTVPGPNGGQSTYQISSSAVVLPNTTGYSFQYTSLPLPQLPGETSRQTVQALSQITFPSGGSISYGYNGALVNGCYSQYAYAQVASRTVNANDGTGPHTWYYSWNYSTYVVTVTDPLGNVSLHTFGAIGAYGEKGFCFPYESQVQDEDNNGNIVRTTSTEYSSITAPYYEGSLNVLPSSVTTTWQNGDQSQVSFTHDRDHGASFEFGTMLINEESIEWASKPSGYTGNLWSKAETDYGNPTPGATLRTTNTTYQAFVNSNYLASNLLDLTNSVQIQDGGGTQRAYTYYGYDETTPQSSGITEQKVAGESYPGNQTSVHRWLNGNTTGTTACKAVTGGYLLSTEVYYDTGEVHTGTDPCGYTTTYNYANEGNGNSNSTCAATYYYGGYLTSITNALGQITYYCYDFNTGAVTSITDPNSQTTTENYDILGRLTSVNYPDGGLNSYCYSDMPSSLDGACPSGPPFQVIETKALYSTTVSETSTVVVDGLGRLSQTQLNSDPSGADYTLTTYDALGRKSVVYNPTRCSTITSNCKTETTWGSTTTNYDALSRVTSVVEQDGSTVSTSYGTTPPSGYSGYCTTVTDEVGNSRESCVDGLGRMTSVLEDPGSSPHLNYLTVYGYDALGDLTGVTQYGSSGGSPRVRTFTYNSLADLTGATNPESGTLGYAYDADGNTITRTAPSPNQASAGKATVATTYTYDKLNRLTGKSYSDSYNPSTASVSYGYDGVAPSGCTPPTVVSPVDSGIPITPTNTIGRRSGMCDASGATAWIYDSMGRPTIEERTLNGVTKNMGYIYYLDGQQRYVRYASDDAMGYGITAAGRLDGVEGQTDNFVYNSAAFAPGGELTSMAQYVHFGSYTVGFASQFVYNARLQPELAYAGYNGTDLFERCYDYHQTQSVIYGGLTCSASATSPADNGNVYQISNLLTSARTQSFTYDSLNRVSQAYSTGSNWGQAFNIDAWGNLTAVSAISGKTPVGVFTATATTANQLTNSANSFTYDAAGNMTSDGNGTITYDDENRISTAGGVTYTYDGDGKRVEKSSGTLYWTGVGSDVLSESDLSGNLNEEYIYFYGMRVARIDLPSDTVHGFLLDHLNSSRMSVVPSGTNTLTVEEDLDYTPYGIVAYGTPSDPFQFTGKERDSESGLDNFDFRYYGSSIGRFMKPDDPFNWNQSDPQSLNLYAYVRNSPTTLTDPDGNNYTVCDANGQNCADLNNDQYNQYLQSLQGTNFSVNSAGQIQYTNDNGSVTTVGTASYYNEQDVQAAQMLVQTGRTLSDPRTIAGFYGASFLLGGCAIACPAAGSAALTAGRGLYYAIAGLLPAVPSAIDKLQKLGISISEANELIESPTTQKLIDNANSGNINYIADVGGKLVRITTDPTGQRIISAGMVRANQIANGITSGRFTPQ